MSTSAPGPLFRTAGTAAGLESVRTLMNAALDILQEVSAQRTGPVAAGGPEGARAAAREALTGPLLPEDGSAPETVLSDLIRPYAQWSADLTHPAALARMQPPPIDAAAVAELVAAVLNQSLHAWESGPFALELDRWVVARLAELAGYDPEEAGGTLTPGGSVSNLMAMTMARDTVLAEKTGVYPFLGGMRACAGQPVVLCPAGVHFSIERAVRLLGIGEENIVTVPVDKAGRMIPEEADRILRELPEDRIAVAMVAVAGSTDLGIVDPLPELAAVARRHGVWLHADAAYGAGALFSPACAASSTAWPRPTRSRWTCTSSAGPRPPRPCCWSAGPRRCSPSACSPPPASAPTTTPAPVSSVCRAAPCRPPAGPTR